MPKRREHAVNFDGRKYIHASLVYSTDRHV